MPAVPISSVDKAALNIVTDGNMGGLTKFIYAIRADALAGEPALDANSAHATGDFTYEDSLTEVFAKLYHTKNTGEARYELQGEFDGKSYRQMVEFSIPTLDIVALNAARNLCNEDIVCVVKDKLGKFFQIGTIDDPANMEEATGGTGKAGADPRRTNFIISSEHIVPLIEIDQAPQSVVGL